MENQQKYHTQSTSRPLSSPRSSLTTSNQERISTSNPGNLTPHLRRRTPVNKKSKIPPTPRMTFIPQNKETREEDYQNQITPQLITLNRH